MAASAHGKPDFLALLHGRHVPACVYAFDLMELQGRDLRDHPLVERRAKLKALLASSKGKPRCERLAGGVRVPRARRHRVQGEGCAVPVRFAIPVG
jgi:ATP-dependent DNA ligase